MKTQATANKSARLLQAAMAAAVLLTGASLAQAADDKQPSKVEKAADKVEQVSSDSWITTKVKSEILANSVSKAFKVEVETKNGTVWLKGKLANKDAIDLVKKIAEDVKGVKSVDTTGLSVG